MNTHYAVYNIARNEFVALGLCTQEVAEAEAARLNFAMKPEHRNYAVVAVQFV